MTRPVPRAVALCGAALLVVGLAACGSASTGSGATGSGAPTAGLAIATAPPPDTPGADEDDPDAAPAVHGPVSANTASEDEITEALVIAGVGDPGRWAKEVVAHRPYPTDDRKLTTLRAALAKDGPDPGTVDKIVSALKP